MTSRERVLRTIAGEPTDHTPLAMILFSGLKARCQDEPDYIRRQLELGLDAIVDVTDTPMRQGTAVTTEVWVEPAQPNPLLHKVYRTPDGDLEAVVEMTADWPHGRNIPLASDFVIPRSRKFLVTEQRDLAALRHLFAESTDEDRAAFARSAESMKALAARHGLATRGGFNRLSDMICWLCGCEQFATMGLTDPGLLEGLVDLIGGWQERRVRTVLAARPDVLVDAQWYATTFLSPDLYERFLLPALARRAELAHEAGAKFCVIATTNVLPFAGIFKRMGVDMIFGVDPIQGGWDLAAAKRDLGDRVCLCGGINGYLTLVDGSEDDVRQAVREAMAVLAPGGRFILSAVDDVRTEPDSPPGAWDRAWRNVQTMVEEWKKTW